MIRKRGEGYVTDFSVHGKRVRQALGTKSERQAKRLAEELKRRLLSGDAIPLTDVARQRLSVVAEEYLSELALTKRPGSVANARGLLKCVLKSIGDRRLREIALRPALVHGHMKKRLEEGATPARINDEVEFVLRMLKRGRLDQQLRPYIKRMEEPERKACILTEAQKARLFAIAASDSRFLRAYHACLLIMYTGMRPGELRLMQWKDLNVDLRFFEVHRFKEIAPSGRPVTGTKSPAGEREIPLTAPAWEVVMNIRRLAEEHGTYAPENFLFHSLVPFDPARPASCHPWCRYWRQICTIAATGADGGEAMPELAHHRIYDLRHQATTEMDESHVPDLMKIKIIGHSNFRTLHVYSHPGIEAKRKALGTIAAVRDPQAPVESALFQRRAKAYRERVQMAAMCGAEPENTPKLPKLLPGVAGALAIARSPEPLAKPEKVESQNTSQLALFAEPENPQILDAVAVVEKP